MKKYIKYIATFALSAFALLTLFLSSSVIFDWFGIRDMEGNYVLFIVWANFISSWLYLFAAYGFSKSKRWTAAVLGGSFLILFLAFIALQFYINSGGGYEPKTPKAMIFRSTITAIFALLAYYFFNKKEKKKIFFNLILLSTIVSLSSFERSNESEFYSLTISVDNLRNSDGVVQFTIYNKEGTIPDEDYENYFMQRTSDIINNSSLITFENLPQGIYAINILHDEDKNGRIKKGWVLPVEGIGFSNFESIGLMHRPNFSKASFELKSNTTKKIKIVYM